MRTRTRVAAIVGLVVLLIVILTGPLVQILTFGGRLTDRSWLMARSEEEGWLEAQKFIGRYGWFWGADSFVGACGDEYWVQWTIENLIPRAGKARNYTFRDEQERALEMMTNHDPNATGVDWPAWWAANKGKTQKTWIRDGFQAIGIVLSDPLTRENIRDLLALCGASGPPWRYTGGQYYNAFRWLRDSGFLVGELTMEDLQGPQAESVLAGYGAYCWELERRWSLWQRTDPKAGRLDLPSIKRRPGPGSQPQDSSGGPTTQGDEK